jgi:2'-hydroxyisoflavone reductase
VRFLVLGGTQFVGRHIVEAAIERNHDVTLFNRGRTNPQLFAELQRLRGDRDGDLRRLAGRSFDSVIDTSGYLPGIVGRTIEALGDVGHYTFVSTMSVYAEEDRALGEEAPVATLPEPTEDRTNAMYGAQKALCEQVVRERFSSAFIVRPGLIVGPWDPTGRFTYWPVRVARGGRVLAPEPPDAPVQLIHAGDLADWIVRAAERRLSGTFNAISPPMTMAEVLDTCRAVSGSDAELIWVDGRFLEEHGVGPWMELPLWVGPEPSDAMRAPVGRALAHGLRIRPLSDTVSGTLSWARANPIEQPAGLEPAKEHRVLEAWESHRASASPNDRSSPSRG